MQALITTVDKLQTHLGTGRAIIHGPLLSDVLKSVLDGFNASDFTKNGVRNFVKEYKAQAKKR